MFDFPAVNACTVHSNSSSDFIWTSLPLFKYLSSCFHQKMLQRHLPLFTLWPAHLYSVHVCRRNVESIVAFCCCLFLSVSALTADEIAVVFFVLILSVSFILQWPEFSTLFVIYNIITRCYRMLVQYNLYSEKGRCRQRVGLVTTQTSSQWTRSRQRARPAEVTDSFLFHWTH